MEELHPALVPQSSAALMVTTYLIKYANYVSLVASAKREQKSPAVLLNCVGQAPVPQSLALIICLAPRNPLLNKLFVPQENTCRMEFVKTVQLGKSVPEPLLKALLLTFTLHLDTVVNILAPQVRTARMEKRL